MSEPAGRIVVADVTKSFGDVRAVDGLGFTAEPGQVTGFLGPNGAGKTTTLRILLGLVRADAGTATIGGRAYRDLPRPADVVGAALDAAGFHPARSAREHLRVLSTANGYATSRVEGLLERVGLAGAGDRRVGGFSLGMRQRLAVAAALLGDPLVLVLDEPANGLDPDGIVWMRRLLRQLADEGRTVLVSSHILTEMQQVVDAVVIVHRGRLVRQGPISELSEASEVSVRTPEVERLATLLAHQVDRVEQVDVDHLHVTGADAAAVGRVAARHGIELHGLTAPTRDLERIFFSLTAGTAMDPHDDTDRSGQP